MKNDWKRVFAVEGAQCRPEHDPEKWTPVFPCDKREAFARRSCLNNKIERDDDSKKSYPALATDRTYPRHERVQDFAHHLAVIPP